jgi:hypothetical protein
LLYLVVTVGCFLQLALNVGVFSFRVLGPQNADIAANRSLLAFQSGDPVLAVPFPFLPPFSTDLFCMS